MLWQTPSPSSGAVAPTMGWDVGGQAGNMGRKLIVELVVAVVIIVGGVIGYFHIVPVNTVATGRLSKLVLSNPDIAHIQGTASLAQPTPIEASGLASLIQGATLDPGQTGAFTSQWFGLGAAGGSAAIFVELLPNTTLAGQAATEQLNQTMSDSALKKANYPVKSRFTIPGIPGSSAVYYQIPKPAKKNAAGKSVPQPPSAGYTGLIEVGRSVSRIDLQGPASSKAALFAVAKREAALMRKYVPSWPNMATVAYPLWSSVLWALLVLGVVGIDFLVPVVGARFAAAKAQREAARRRYQLQSRGSKVVRRRAQRTRR